MLRSGTDALAVLLPKQQEALLDPLELTLAHRDDCIISPSYRPRRSLFLPFVLDREKQLYFGIG